ncbi:MAG: Asp-tRNA(Asn)/Glu-tRNA(Gln) amidotransferase subunit GatC [Ruminococcus sp.]|nr:Asp-tRNA(Asn)/Glu-tRNA(Gln) amidotransferase subunit GatC [Ruminococcus sp.]
MDLKMLKHLADLSKLDISDAAAEKLAREMSEIIKLMDTVKSVDIVYDVHDGESVVGYGQLRADEVQPSLSLEDVLKNAADQSGAFAVPKVVG